MYQFSSKEELLVFLNEALVTTAEAKALHGCSRQNLDNMVKHGRLKPARAMSRDRLYWREDILALQHTAKPGRPKKKKA